VQAAIFRRTKRDDDATENSNRACFAIGFRGRTSRDGDRTSPHANEERATACEQWRNSNAYAAPGDISVQSVQSEGAMTSGITGH
jgi:hypothetical protein